MQKRQDPGGAPLVNGHFTNVLQRHLAQPIPSVDQAPVATASPV